MLQEIRPVDDIWRAFASRPCNLFVNTRDSLEQDLHSELDDTGIASRGDGPEVGRAQHGVGRAERWSVEEVEGLDSKLQRACATERHATNQREVDRPIGRTAYRIPIARSDRELRRDRKGCCIEPSVRCPLVGWE